MPKVILGVKLFTLQETADLMGVTRHTAKTYTEKRGLKSTTIGGVKYISEENLKEFLQMDEKDITK